MNDFLPKDYSVPGADGGYMKFKPGENRFRILSSPVLGWEWWVRADGSIRPRDERPGKGDKPKRVKMTENITADQFSASRHFWALTVWNYDAERVQILQLHQKGIQKFILSLSKDSDWGDPKGTNGYDIVVTREGEGLETEYSVSPKPKKRLPESILTECNKVSVNLDALFDGEDPFARNQAVPNDEINF